MGSRKKIWFHNRKTNISLEKNKADIKETLYGEREKEKAKGVGQLK